MAPEPHGPAWLRSDRFLARSVARPVNRFLAIEASGGLLLAGAAVVALLWANSPWDSSYHQLWSTPLTVGLDGHDITLDLRHWINDGLMTLFFFVIGLEIKDEIANGQLTSAREAAVPLAGALGGMVVPAALFVAVNAGSPGIDGWGIPMATDVAFAVGVLALLGSRVPPRLKVVLLGLAIVDDVGAIVVIAVFYSDGLRLEWLAAAGGGLVVVTALRRARVRHLIVHLALGCGVWLATLESGVHATIAGVAIGLLTPADRAATSAVEGGRSAHSSSSAPITQRLQASLHPWTSYVIVPLFALANAGVPVSGAALGAAAASRITLGVVLGLVVGKLVGVAGAIALVVKLGLGRLPAGITSRHVLGMAALAGIGFTVSIFVTGLAYDDPGSAAEAKIGVLLASLIAALLGAAILAGARSGAAPTPPAEDQA